MTFEQLEQIAIEQQTRIITLACIIEYNAEKSFCASHFRLLRQKYLHMACWEAVIKTKFPFDHLIPNIDMVHTISDINGIEKVFTGVRASFTVTILNSPGIQIEHLATLISMFLTYLDDQLVRYFKLPIDISNSNMLVEIPHVHTLYTAFNKNKPN